MKRMHVGGLVGLLFVVACAVEEATPPVASPPRLGDSSYEKFLVRAEAGDMDAQNLVGFMLYFGEGVMPDKVEAHYWFHRAAEQGHEVAQLNLAIMHTLGQDAVADPGEAAGYFAQSTRLSAEDRASIAEGRLPLNYWKTVLDRTDEARVDRSAGRANFEKFCAGCHGLNGVARYVVSPSFAIGERMDKSDETLLDSIANGRGNMPSWREKLDEDDRREILAYVRTLEARFRMGIALTLRETPARYFTFGPMEGRPFEPGDKEPDRAPRPTN